MDERKAWWQPTQIYSWAGTPRGTEEGRAGLGGGWVMFWRRSFGGWKRALLGLDGWCYKTWSKLIIFMSAILRVLVFCLRMHGIKN